MSALEAVQAINDLIETSIMALDAANNSDTLCVYGTLKQARPLLEIVTEAAEKCGTK